MTIQATIPYFRYIYSGVGNYTFDFKILKTPDISVVYVDADGVPTTLVLGTDYTVTINSPSDGGTVASTYPPTTGFLELRRSMSIDQLVAWVNNDSFDMSILEDAMDKAIMIIQQQNLLLEQGITYILKGLWITATIYKMGDIVQYPSASGNQYLIKEDHTSGTWATDLAAGKLALYLEVQPAIDVANNWASEAEDVTVNDGVNPVDYSAYHWSRKAAEITYPNEITVDTTLYVKASPATGEFSTLTAAIAYLNTKRFPTVNIIINIAGFTTTEPANVFVSHADGRNLSIVGQGSTSSIIDKAIDISKGSGLNVIEKISVGVGAAGLSIFGCTVEKIKEVNIKGRMTLSRAKLGTFDTVTVDARIELSNSSKIIFGSSITCPDYLILSGISSANIYGITLTQASAPIIAVTAYSGSYLVISNLSIGTDAGGATGVHVDTGAVIKLVGSGTINLATTPYSIPTGVWQADGSAIFLAP